MNSVLRPKLLADVHVKIALCVMTLVCWTSGGAAAQGKLSQALNEAAGHSTPSSSSSSSSEPSYENYHSPSSFSESSSASRSNCQTESSAAIEKLHWYGYAAYPYASETTPYVLLGPTGSAYARRHDRPGRSFAGRMSADTGYAYGVLHAYARGQVLTPSVFELALAARALYEHGEHHTAAIFSADVTAGMLQQPLFSASLLAGARYFGDVHRGYFGAVAGIVADFFATKPLVFSFALEAGMLGRALYAAGRLQVGVMLGPVEIYAGGELLAIGEVPLHRPLVGVRAWL